MIARELLVKLGFKIDSKKLDAFQNNIESIKARITTLQNKVAQTLSPKVNIAEFVNYQKELQELSSSQRSEIVQLNKLEQLKSKEDVKRYRMRIRQLSDIKRRLQDNNREFKRAGIAARVANETFSRFFIRFSLAAIGGIGLNIRSTLKDAKDYKEGKRNKNSGGFSQEQINNVDAFNRSLIQTKRITSSIRNTIVTNLLPSIKEYLDILNRWLLSNRELIKQKIEEFFTKLSKLLKAVSTVFKGVYNSLDPLIELIGGWSNLLTGFIGAGILSWIVRLGVFLGRAGNAILFAGSTIKVLTLALLRNPMVLAISAIVGAFTLLINEIYVTMQGGDSLINRFKPLRDAFDLTRIVVEGFVEGLKEAWRWISIVGKKIGEFSSSAFDKVTGFFADIPTIKLFPEVARPKGFDLEKITGLDTKLNIYKVSGNNKIFSNIEPRSITASNIASSSVNNNNTRNVVTNRNNINLSISLREGTTEKQATEIARLVETKLQEQNNQGNLDSLNAIGAY